MPLENFGSILNFAEEIENQDLAFYQAVADNPACARYKEMFAQFAANTAKNLKAVQRTRRENVTEMILEPIRDFTRAPFCEQCEEAPAMNPAEALETARRLEQRAQRYYLQAAEKIKAQPEVARALKMIAKKRRAHLERLENL